MELILDSKTQVLVALGAAVAAKCQKCFATLYETASKADINDSEIRSVVAIASRVTARSESLMADFIEQTTEEGLAPRRAAQEPPAGCGCGT